MDNLITVEVEKKVFQSPNDRGFIARAFYLKPPHDADALIEILRDGNVSRRFLFPAYRVWNIAAHFKDIVDGELENSTRGYEYAAWDGISGAVVLLPDT